MKKKIALFYCIFALSGCTQLNSLGIEEGENAVACIKAGAAGSFIPGSASGVLIEIPSNVDTSQWTAEDFVEVARAISEICD